MTCATLYLDMYKILTCVALDIHSGGIVSNSNEAKLLFNTSYIKFMQFEMGLFDLNR